MQSFFTIYNFLFFIPKKGVTFQAAIITNGLRSFVRYSYGEMQWRTLTKNVQVGFQFPSLRDNCKKSLNVPLTGHNDYKYPLDKIVGNIGDVGVWMYEISSQRTPINDVTGMFVILNQL